MVCVGALLPVLCDDIFFFVVFFSLFQSLPSVLYLYRLCPDSLTSIFLCQELYRKIRFYLIIACY